MYKNLKNSKKLWSIALTFTIVEAISYMTIPLIQKKIIDGIIEKNYMFIDKYIILMLILYLLHYIFQIIRAYYDAKLSTNIKTEFQKKIYNKLLESNIADISKNKIGKLITVMNSDILTVSNYLSSTLKLLTYNIFIVVFLLSIMFSLSKSICFVIVTLFTFIYYFNSFHNERHQKYKIEVQENKENFSEILNQSITGLKIIKSNNLKEYFNDKVKKITEIDKQVSVKSIVFSNVLGALTKYTLTGGRVIIFFIGINQIRNSNLTVGSLLALLNYYEFMYNPILQFRSFLEGKEKSKISYSRIVETFRDEENFFTAKEEFKSFKSLIFNSINFSYGNKKIHKNFNYRIDKGDKIAVIGDNGTGKSTLINILTGINKINSGKIILNSKDFYHIDIKSFRNKLSILYQENNLFDLSIEENLKLGNLKANYNEIREVCEKLGIHKFIENLPEGYKTNIEYLGSNFSGGEKRKLLLGRTLLKEADIYIFDELTTNLDKISRDNIIDLILKLFKDKTVLFITHNHDEISKFEKTLNLNII